MYCVILARILQYVYKWRIIIIYRTFQLRDNYSIHVVTETTKPTDRPVIKSRVQREDYKILDTLCLLKLLFIHCFIHCNDIITATQFQHYTLCDIFLWQKSSCVFNAKRYKIAMVLHT